MARKSFASGSPSRSTTLVVYSFLRIKNAKLKKMSAIFGVYFVVFEAICSIHQHCAIFLRFFKKQIIIANKKESYRDNSQTQKFNLLF